MSVALRQQKLRDLGYDPGPVDGELGPRTKAAALQFAWDELDELISGAATPMAPPLSPIVAQQPKATRPITEIIIHCTATPEGRDIGIADVRRWHTTPGWQGSPNGWSDAGYHWLVRLDGTVEQGRPEAKVGAHVLNHNTGTLGVVYAGGVDRDGTPKDTRTPQQRKALMALCQALAAKYPTITKISGHRDYTKAKSCPSFSVKDDPLGSLLP